MPVVEKVKVNTARNSKKMGELLKKGKKSPFPTDIVPMLATLVDSSFDEPGWIYEVKWDGFRALSYLNKGNVDIRSRNNKVFNEKFYPLYKELKNWNINAVIDGEIIVVNEKGLSDFNALQTWRSEADGELVYYVFDILWLDGFDLSQIPLTNRRKILRTVMPAKAMIRISETSDESGHAIFELAQKMNFEGVIAKKGSSVYNPGVRSKEWLKIKTEKHQEAIIAGYTRNENSSKKISALLLGLYENGGLEFIGPVGTGFTNAMQEDILKKLKPLITKKCPFKTIPEYNKPSRFRPNPPKAEVTWVKPQLVAEISYRSLTDNGSLRHPSFRGLRPDKEAKQIVREKEQQTEDIMPKEKKVKNNKLFQSSAKTERKTLLNPKDEMQVRNIGGHDLKFTNLSKIFWPKEKVTKRDMINYYYQVAPFMLPYFKDRPQTLNRHPHGINGESFYQKDVTGKVPEWIKTFPYHSEADERDKNFLVVTNEASLLYLASLGCIEMNPWSNRIQSPDHPDWCIIDLDPDKNTFQQVIEAAQVTRKILDSVQIPSYCKTSGSTGLHIYIPLGAKYTYEESKEFGRVIVKLVHAQIPGYTSIERLTQNREGKMYLDFLQNRPQATVAGPYSLRPKQGAPVSMPLHWDEVKKGLKIQDFTIFNAVDRLKSQGDIFKDVLGKGVNLKQSLKKIDSVFKK